jgi:predicted amino acid dehydrogenase
MGYIEDRIADLELKAMDSELLSLLATDQQVRHLNACVAEALRLEAEKLRTAVAPLIEFISGHPAK